MNKQLIILLISSCLIMTTMVMAKPVREGQSCATQYSSWYYNKDQQCMQCYSYESGDGGADQLCHKCNGEKCSGECFGQWGTVTATRDLSFELQTEEKKTETFSYCRRCGSGDSDAKNCCWMDDKKKFLEDTTAGWSSNYKTQGYHITTCRSNGDTYVAANGITVVWNSPEEIRQYGSVCHRIPNCAKIGEYGHCMTCVTGYYLGPSLVCMGCENHNWKGSNDSFIREYKITADLSKLATIFNDAQDANSEATGNVCIGCNGPMECTHCKRGYYLSRNHNRETYDTNIAKHASFCRPCNDGCYCNDHSDKCVGCLDSSYYHDTIQNKCIKCSTIEGQCNQCQWIEELQSAKCTSCNSRTGVDDSSQNIIQFPLKYHVRNGDTVTEYRNVEVTCVPCNEIYASTSGTYLKLAYTQTVDTASTFTLGANPVSTVVFSTFNSYNKNYIRHFTTIEDEQVKSTHGCSECELKSVDASKTELGDSEVNLDEQLHYITCTSCHNGFAEERIPSFQLDGHIADSADAAIKLTYKRWWTIPSSKKCHRCQRLLRQYDDQLSFANNFAADGNSSSRTKYVHLNGNRQGLVRRCELNGSPKGNFHSYTITQCGSIVLQGTADADNYMNASASHNDNTDRGTGIFNGKNTVAEQAGIISVTDYFSKDANRLGYFKVALASTVPDSQTLTNACVHNIKRCRQIIPLSHDKSGSTYSNEESYSPIDAPRCVSCFPGYIKTEDRTCVFCPMDGLNSSSDQGNTSIGKGCNRCGQVTTVRTENDNPTADKFSQLIKCTRCYNGRQCESQGYLATTSGSQARSATGSNYTLLNYWHEADTNNCTQCNKGCLTCSGPNKHCTEPQNYFRIKDGLDGGDEAEFELCEVNFCRKCHANLKQCQLCDAGFAIMKFTLEDSEVHECERCERGCSKCTADTSDKPYARTVCSECDRHTHYLSGNVCKPARANCINWVAKGGECLQCSHGNRLQNGWCYSCTEYTAGFWDCPAGCDSETGITKSTSNVRNAAALTLAAEKTGEKNPAAPAEDESAPTTRILQILDEFRP